MNKKQFEAMQLAVQDAADDVDRPKRVSHGWNQDSWFLGPAASHTPVAKKHGEPLFPLQVTCTSAACIAGNGVINAGDRMLASAGNADGEDDLGNSVYSADYCLTLDGRVRRIEKRAAELFGLTGDEAGELFAAGNSLDTIIYLADTYASRHGYTLNINRSPDRFNIKEKIDA